MYRFQFLNETYELDRPHVGALAAIALGLTFGLAFKPWASDFDGTKGPQLVMGPRMDAASADDNRPQYASYRPGPTPWWVTGTYWRQERQPQPVFRDDVWRERGWDRPAYEPEPLYADARFEPYPVATHRAPLYPEPKANPDGAAKKREVFVADDQGRREIDDPAHWANPGAQFGEPPAKRPNLDRPVEFNDPYRAPNPDVYDAVEAPAGRETFAQGGFDPRNGDAPVTLREHIQRSLGGGAG